MARALSSADSPRFRRWLLAAMAGCVALALALSVWDEQRESAAALDDFAREQAALAASVAAETGAHFTKTAPLVPGEDPLPIFFEAAAKLEPAGATLALVREAGSDSFRAAGQAPVPIPELARALDANLRSAWLDRGEAVRLGLPARRAAAGLARFEGPGRRFEVAILTSAEHEREREARAEIRLIASVSLAAGLVFLFGVIGLRRERRKLALERELDLAAADRARDERLAQANRAATLGTLAMGIAHEVSTPLGVIAGRAEQILGRAAEDEKGARAARGILEETEKIRIVIRGFLDLARGGPPALAPVDAREVVDEAVRLVRHRFEKAEVALAVARPAEAAEIQADAAMLRQAVANLLLNACHASERGGAVEARVELGEDRVELSVLDDGAGIPVEVAARVLEPFFTTKPAGEGTGLGLAIANEIVKLHRGSLTVAPRSPRGTRAAIELPRRTRMNRAA